MIRVRNEVSERSFDGREIPDKFIVVESHLSTSLLQVTIDKNTVIVAAEELKQAIANAMNDVRY